MYNKIFTKILDSSVWLESNPTRIVWFTLLAAMDETGFAQFASPANLAHRARVTLDETVAALACFEGPDPHSSDPDNDGRRIERVDGGWIVLNAEKYRDLVTRAISQEKTRLRVAKFREKKKCNASVTLSTKTSRSVTPSEADHKQDQEYDHFVLAENNGSNGSAPAKPKKPREPNPLFDALCEIEGSNPKEIGKAGGRIGKALSAIQAGTPDVTPEEIHRRAANYKISWPNMTLTAQGLASYWAKFGTAKQDNHANPPLDAASAERRRAF